MTKNTQSGNVPSDDNTLSPTRRRFLSLAAAGAVSTLLEACGGGAETAPTTPTIETLSIKNGALQIPASGIYALSGNIATTQEYTVTLSQPLGATSYNVIAVDASGTQISFPTGMTTPTLTANDATNKIYTLTITTDRNLIYPVGQTSQMVRLQAVLSNTTGQTATIRVNDTINYVSPTLPATLADISVGDNGGITPVSFSINMPALKDAQGNQINYSVTGLPTTDVNGAVTWTVSQVGSTINISGIYSGFIVGNIDTYNLSVSSLKGTGSTTTSLKILAN